MVHATFKSKNPFKGAPSPELDHAWHQLFVNSNVRVSADDLQKINRTSVPLGVGSGYYAIPGEFETRTVACDFNIVAVSWIKG